MVRITFLSILFSLPTYGVELSGNFKFVAGDCSQKKHVVLARRLSHANQLRSQGYVCQRRGRDYRCRKRMPVGEIPNRILRQLDLQSSHLGTLSFGERRGSNILIHESLAFSAWEVPQSVTLAGQVFDFWKLRVLASGLVKVSVGSKEFVWEEDSGQFKEHVTVAISAHREFTQFGCYLKSEGI